nr:site-specific DNA-methyltransferase [uncultured Lichenicoccus sp.]
MLPQMPDHSVGFSIFSPPFSSLFTYSDSIADLGNAASHDEFLEHYRFITEELARVIKPGRLVAVHCSDLPFTKWKDGIIGIRDFSGDLVRVHEAAGFVLHSRVTIWKCPVIEMTRTKALGLLHKQLLKDSAMSRQGMADYLLVFRAPGVNEDPVSHRPQDLPVATWQKWASPVWMDIRQSNTLNVAIARDAADERHACPLQLDLIERAVTMWSNPGDVVLSPFLGVGSEGFVSLRLKRKFVGIELKESYWRTACRNLGAASDSAASLFDMAEDRAMLA